MNDKMRMMEGGQISIGRDRSIDTYIDTSIDKQAHIFCCDIQLDRSYCRITNLMYHISPVCSLLAIEYSLAVSKM